MGGLCQSTVAAWITRDADTVLVAWRLGSRQSRTVSSLRCPDVCVASRPYTVTGSAGEMLPRSPISIVG